MVEIVTGSGLGWQRTSGSLLGANGTIGSAFLGRAREQVAVNAANGNLLIRGQDEVLAGVGLSSSVNHTYNSLGQVGRPIGNNWQGIGAQIVNQIGTPNTDGSSVQRVDWDGSLITYVWNGSFPGAQGGAYVAANEVDASDTLQRSGNVWLWRDGATGVTEQYEASATAGAWRVQSKRDSNGQGLTFIYDAAGRLSKASTSSGEFTLLVYNAAGNLSQLTTQRIDGSAFSRATYGYDAQNRLTSVMINLNPDGVIGSTASSYTTSYTCGDVGSTSANLVRSITQTDGSKLEFDYDASGRVVTYREFTNSTTYRSTQFVYNAGSTSITTLSAAGAVLSSALINYDGVQRLRSIIESPGDVASQRVRSFEYNAQGKLVEASVSQGQFNSSINRGATLLTQTIYRYDTRGNATLRWTWGQGTASNWTYSVYDSADRLTASSQASGAPDLANPIVPAGALTTAYRYDANGNLRFVVSPQGRVVEYRYNGFGQAIAEIDHASLYSGAVAMSLADLSFWAQDPAQLTRGQRTDTSYDFRGNVQSVTRYSALNSSGSGDLTKALSRVSYFYNQAGLLLSRQGNDGSTAESFVYDGMGRVVSYSNGVGATTRTTYVDAQNQTRVTLANGLVTTTNYDGLGAVALVSQAQSVGVTSGTYSQNLAPPDLANWSHHNVTATTAPAVAPLTINGAPAVELAAHASGGGAAVSTQINWRAGETFSVTISLRRGVGTYASDTAAIQILDLEKFTNGTNGNSTATISGPGVLTQIQGALWAVSGLTDEATTLTVTRTFTAADTDTPADADRANIYIYADFNGGVTRANYNILAAAPSVVGSRATTTNPDLALSAAWTPLNATTSSTSVQVNGQPATQIAVGGNGSTAALVTGFTATAGDSLSTTLSLLAGTSDNAAIGISANLDGYGINADSSAVVVAGPGQLMQAAGGLWIITGLSTSVATTVTVRRRFSQTETGGIYLMVDVNSGSRAGRTIIAGSPSIIQSVPVVGTAGALEAWAEHNVDVTTLSINGASATRIMATANGGGAALSTPIVAAAGDTFTVSIALLADTATSAALQILGNDDRGDSTATISGPGTLVRYPGTSTWEVQGLSLAQPTILTVTRTFTAATSGRVYLYANLNNGVAVAGSSVYAAAPTITASAAVTTVASINYRYDAAGDLRYQTDPNGMRSFFFYDQLHRRVGAIDSAGTLTVFRYDGANRLIEQTRYATPVTGAALTSLVDASGNPSNVSLATVVTGVVGNSPAVDGNQHSWNIYDEASRLVEVVTATSGVNPGSAARGTLIGFVYDSLGRVVETRQYANFVASTIISGWLSSGGPTAPIGGSAQYGAAASSADRVTRNYFEGDGLLIGVLDGENYLTENEYDGLGHVIHTVRYAKQVSSISGSFSDIRNRAISAATAARDQHNYFFYDGRGLLVATVDAERYVTRYTYSTRGQVASQEQGRRLAATQAITLAIAQVAAVETVLQVTRYTYDGEGRQISQVKDLANGGSTSTINSFDIMGNLLRQTTIDTRVPTVGSPVVETRSVYSEYDQAGRILRSLTGAGVAWLTTNYGANPSRQNLDTAYQRFGVSYAYNAAGLLVSRTAPDGTGSGSGFSGNGLTTYFYYDTAGRLRFTINALGEVSETRYDAFGNIQKTVAYGRAIATTGLTGGLVTDSLILTVAGIANSSAQQVGNAVAIDRETNYSYNADGTLSVLTDARSDQTSYRYNAFGEANEIIEHAQASAQVRSTRNFDMRGLLLSTVADTSGIAASATNGYDAFGNRVYTIDARGNRETADVEYDRRNRLTRGFDAVSSNAVAVFEYDAFDNVIRSTDAKSAITTITYDQFSRTVTTRTPENVQTVLTRNGFGQTLAQTDGASRTTRFEYDADGSLKATEQSPSTGVTLRSTTLYDAAGRVEETRDARGIVTRYTYDRAGRVLSRTEDFGVDSTNPITNAPYLNLATTYSYDARGQSVRVTDARGIVTAYAYDASGNALRIVQDFGSGQNPVTQSPYLNVETAFFYDLEGRVLEQHDGVTSWSNGAPVSRRKTSFTYDGLGRLTRKEVVASGGALSSWQTFAYDKSGNLIASSNDNSNVTRFVYDQANRLVFTVSPSVLQADNSLKSYLTQNIYDANGAIISVRGFAAPIALAQPVMAQSATLQIDRAVLTSFATSSPTTNDHIEHRFYDLDGRLSATLTMGAFFGGSYRSTHGYVVRTFYDDADNVKKIVRYAAPVELTAAVTSATTATPAPSTDDVTTEYAYDGANRLIDVTSGRANEGSLNVTHYELDKVGQIVATSVAFGTAQQVTTGRTFDAIGRIKRETRDVGNNDNPATGRPYLNLLTQYDYNSVGDVISVTDPRGSISTSTYDALGRLIEQVVDANRAGPPSYTGLKLTTKYRYDALGNKVAQTDPNGNTGYFFYDQLDRLILQIDPNGYATKTLFGVDDQIVGVTRFATQLALKNTAGAVLIDENTALATLYAGLGYSGATPLGTTGAGAQTRFEYDAAGRLISSIDAMNQAEIYRLDAFGNRVEVHNRLGGVTFYTYDAHGLVLTETTDASVRTGATSGIGSVAPAIVNRSVYDARGNRIRSIEAEGSADQRVTDFTYDALDRLVERREAPLAGQTAQRISTFGYDRRGNLVSEATAGGGKVFSYYDGGDRRVAQVRRVGIASETVANAEVATFEYDANGNVRFQGEANGRLTFPTTVADRVPVLPEGTTFRRTEYRYDAGNRLTDTLAPDPVVVGAWQGSSFIASTRTGTDALVLAHREYDAAGNLTREVDGNGGVVRNYYDLAGRATGRIDQRGFVTRWERDAEGNVVKETRQTAALTSVPTTLPNILPIAGDRVTRFEYDKNGRRTKEIREGVVAWTVGEGGGLLGGSATEAKIEYSYNALGQVRSRQEATGDMVQYDYDSMGRLRGQYGASLTDHNGAAVRQTIYYSYDGLGNVKEMTARATVGGTMAADTLATGYIGTDRITRYTYVGGVMASVQDAENFTRAYEYDAAGRVVREAYDRRRADNSFVTEASFTDYDLAGRVLLQGKETRTGSVWARADAATGFDYDAHGAVIARRLGGVIQERFEYNALGRVVRSTAGDGVWKLFAHDGAGNVTLTVASAGRDLSQTSLAAGAIQALAADAGVDIAVTVTDYDARGQATVTRELNRRLATGATSTAITRSRTYNAFGEVDTETGARNQVTNYSYNSLGRVTRREGPTVSITRENGTVASIRPTETYFHDVSGRLIGTRDANANDLIATGATATARSLITTRTLLAGTGYGDSDQAQATAEFRPDDAILRTGYDAFGEVRTTTNGLPQTTSYSHDKVGRIVSVTRPNNFIEAYTYDGLGNRLTRAHIDPRMGLGAEERTSYDIFGRVTQVVDFHAYATTNAALNAAPFRVTNTTYTWNSALTTLGLGTFGGWARTTEHHAGTLTQALGNGDGTVAGASTAQTLRIATDYSDAFGHMAAAGTNNVSRMDLGGNAFQATYDKGGRLIQQIGLAPNSAMQTGQNLTYTYLNTGRLAAVTDSMRARVATYGYDADGNRALEQYGTGTTQGVSDTQNATASYDVLNRLTWYLDAGGAGRPSVRIDNEYDANGNVRRTKAAHQWIQSNGSVIGAASTEDYWYKYDAMNRFVLTKGQLAGGTIIRGTTGVGLTYDAAGQRKTATQSFLFDATVRRQNTNGSPFIPTTYWGNRIETYFYDAAGYITRVDVGNEGYNDDDDEHAVANGVITSSIRGIYDRDVMGRITAATEYAEGGTQVIQQRTNIAYEHGSSRVESDWVQRWQLGQGGYVNQGIVVSNNSYDGMDQLRLTNGGNYAAGVTPGGSSQPATNHQTQYDYIYRDGALQSVVTAKAKISDSSTHTTSTSTYDSNGFVSSVSTTGQNARTMSYVTDVAGQVIQRSQGGGNAPRVVSTFLGGLKLGEVSNDGTGDTDFATAVNAQATARGTGPFRGGATGGTAYADFDQSYASITPGSMTPVAGSVTAQAGDSFASLAARIWGDASLWYMLADANPGLATGPSGALSAGQAITVPNKIANFHNNSTTFRPYDPNKAVGETQPGAPLPPKGNDCGAIGIIILIAIAVAVTIATSGATIGFAGAPGVAGSTALTTLAPIAGSGLAGALGATGGAIIGGALAAAAGSIVSQAVGVLTEIQDKFNWGAVGLAAISGGIGGGLGHVAAFSGAGTTGLARFGIDAARGALANTLTQEIAMATGLQHRFDWTGVAVGGIVGGTVGAASRGLNVDGAGRTIEGYGFQALTGVAGAVAGGATRSLLTGTDFGDNVMAALPDVIGSTIGNAVARGVVVKAPKIDRSAPYVHQGGGGGAGGALALAGTSGLAAVGEWIKYYLIDHPDRVLPDGLKLVSDALQTVRETDIVVTAERQMREIFGGIGGPAAGSPSPDTRAASIAQAINARRPQTSQPFLIPSRFADSLTPPTLAQIRAMPAYVERPWGSFRTVEAADRAGPLDISGGPGAMLKAAPSASAQYRSDIKHGYWNGLGTGFVSGYNNGGLTTGVIMASLSATHSTLKAIVRPLWGDDAPDKFTYPLIEKNHANHPFVLDPNRIVTNDDRAGLLADLIMAFTPGGPASRAPRVIAAERVAQTGAGKTIPYWDFDAAEGAYSTIRGSNADVLRIAENTGMPEFQVARVKDHLFNATHKLDGGVIGRFDAHPEIANAWGRLEAGGHTPGDMQLLRHELFESKFEGIFRTDYGTAHNAANRAGRPSGIR
jgi:YD repeat-containing protein